MSIDSISLPFYRRQQRGSRFYEFLRNCRSISILLLQIRALAKEEFIIKAGLLGIGTILVLRDIYNKFAKIQYKLIISKTPID